MNDIERARMKRAAANAPASVVVDDGVITLTVAGSERFRGNKRDFFELLLFWRDSGQITHPQLAKLMAAIP